MVLIASHDYRCFAHDRRCLSAISPWDGNDMDTYADDLADLYRNQDTGSEAAG